MKGEEKIKKKKAKKKEVQMLDEQEEGKKKRGRTCTRKRSRSKGRCELSEQSKEQEVIIRQELKDESAEHESKSDRHL